MATVFKARNAWTTATRGGAFITPSRILGIVYHWPGTSMDAFGVESEADVASHIRGWWTYHVKVRGWVDIGYNFAIDQAGRVWDLRGSGRVGAHCASASNPDANWEWIGVLLILGDEEKPSPAMLQACRDFRNQVFLKKFPGKTRVTGHNRVPGASTTCCGPYAFSAIDAGHMVGGSLPPVDEEWNMDENTFKRWVQEAVHSTKIGRSDNTFGTAMGEAAKIDEIWSALQKLIADLPRAVMAYKNPNFGDQDVYERIRLIQKDVEALKNAG